MYADQKIYNSPIGLRGGFHMRNIKLRDLRDVFSQCMMVFPTGIAVGWREPTPNQASKPEHNYEFEKNLEKDCNLVHFSRILIQKIRLYFDGIVTLARFRNI